MPDDRYREELKDYLTVGRQHYVRKRDILTVAFGFFVLSMAVAAILIPLYRKHFGVLTVFSPRLQEFSGYGQVYDLNRELLYEGDISTGIFTGYGKLYRPGGKLLYEGGFQSGEFSGEGALYGSKGRLLYAGQFESNLYHGYGSLYGEDGDMVYQGGFARGKCEGAGRFYEQGVLAYEGGFSNGKYGGQGKLYDKGEPLYAGGFLDGFYNGEGRLYGGGELLYAGGFLDGLYDGQGKLYDEYQGLRYEGGFLRGQYSGQGNEYNQAGRLIYCGAYSDGERNGFGELYSDRGNLLYSGLFLQGKMDYASLLGKHHNEMQAVFPGRKYLSHDSQEMPVFQREEDGELAYEGASFFEEYFCEGYEEIKAAVIFSVKDGGPDYAEAVIVWDMDDYIDYADYIGYEIPFWIDVFYDNEMCPVRLTFPERRAIEDYRGIYQIYFWMETGSLNPDFYTIEYRGSNIEVK